MKRRAHAKRRDLNEPEIVAAIRSHGFRAILLDGPLDLLIGGPDGWGIADTWIAEVKDGTLAPSDRKLTEAEQGFFDTWPGAKPLLLRCVEETLCALEVKPCRAGNVLCGCGEVSDPPWFAAARKAKAI